MRVAALAFLLVASAGPAAAQADATTLIVETSEAVHLDGRVTVEASDGSARSFLGGAPGLLRNATGTIVIETWRQAHARLPGLGVEQSIEPPTRERIEVAGDVHVAFADDALVTIVTRPGGVVGVETQFDESGKPSWLAHPIGTLDPAPAPMDRPYHLPYAWEAGWAFVGAFPSDPPVRGIPTTPGALYARGPVALQLEGGEVRFTDTRGRTHAYSLEKTASAPGVETARTFLFEGALDHATLPLLTEWGMAAPTLAWSFEGDVVWRDATGEARRGDRVERFEHATVQGVGRFDATITQAGLTAARYETVGSWSTLATDAAPLGILDPAPRARLAVGVATGALALLALAAWAAYSRIAKAHLLDHPKRVAILERIRDTPGIHVRDLQRALGLSWGVVEFHLGMLRRAGLIRGERRGRLVLLYLAGTPGGQSLRHPLAERILAEIPHDGTRIALLDVSQRVGASRQLVSHHLRALESEGLLRRFVEPGRETLVGRV